MNVKKIAAFSDGKCGGNPAGVVLCDALPDPVIMQACAAEVGFSETAFAAMTEDLNHLRVRYFSPESEVPFCGHATIALGAALTDSHGPGKYFLQLNEANISVEGMRNGEQVSAALQSPSTSSQALDEPDIAATLALFGYEALSVDDSIAPAYVNAGAAHYVIALKSRDALSTMNYSLDAGREFMRERNLVTVMFVYRENDRLFHVRNAFASGGVLEDPATGAAAAAFSGYLRDINWPHGGSIQIIQGEDMGSRSLITTEFSTEVGTSVRVSGAARNL